jgi:ADP-heptose:LPS heptosyltransferase
VTPRKVVLSLRALGLGDLLTAIPALRAVKRAFVDHVHALAAPAALWPIARASGAVDVLLPTRGLRAQDVPAVGVDVAVNLHGQGPESHRRLLDCAPATLIAFHHPDVSASADGPQWQAEEHEIGRWCRLLEESGIPCNPADLDLEPPPGAVPAAAPGATVLHPGAAAPARRWPSSRWAAVARAEYGEGHPVVITAGPGEQILADTIAEASGVAVTIVDSSDDVGALARTVAAAERVVCGDTGVAHLATAVRTPSVVLCGPTSPALWGPPIDRTWNQALWSGRVGDPHGTQPDPGLLDLTVADVLLALRRLPTRRVARHSGEHARSCTTAAHEPTISGGDDNALQT